MLVLMAGGGRKVFRIMSLSLHLKLGYAVRTLSSKETVIASVHSTRDMQWNSADDNWGFLFVNRIYGRKIEDGKNLEGNWTNLNNCDLHLSTLKKYLSQTIVSQPRYSCSKLLELRSAERHLDARVIFAEPSLVIYSLSNVRCCSWLLLNAFQQRRAYNMLN